jgi:hypothetical protein
MNKIRLNVYDKQLILESNALGQGLKTCARGRKTTIFFAATVRLPTSLASEEIKS